MIRGWLGCLLLVMGCAGGGPDHERQGDAHFRAGRFDEAVLSYRSAVQAGGAAEGWAKLGAAALAAGDPATAVEAYEQLGVAEPSRAAEAARGLERALRRVDRGADSLQVAARAVRALHRISPDRPLGRLAAAAVMDLPDSGNADLLPSAVAGALAGDDVDRLLVRTAAVLQAGGSCDAAVRIYRTALRRAQEPGERAAATAGVGSCALRLGEAALAADRLEEAERWFNAASAADTTGPVGLLARLGWGDARLRQGDVLGAALVWQAVRSLAGAPDSLVRRATERLERLAGAEPPGADRDVVP